VRDEAPHVALAPTHEGAEREAVAVAGRNGQPREIIQRRATILGNLERPGVDYLLMDLNLMDCERTRTAISARLDGEDIGVPAEAVRAHLGACVECRAYQKSAASLHAQVRVAPAPLVPDLTSRILGAIGADDGGASPHLEAWRIGLAFIAILQIGLAVPALLLGTDAGLPVHTARHLGSFAVALGVGFLFAAWRPSRVAGLFPVAAALVACLVITSAIDIASGRAAAVNEVTHMTELLGLALLWLVGRAAPAERSTVPAIVAGPA